MADSLSYLTPAGYQRSSCGYCHSKPKRTRASVGAISSTVKPEQYQELVDRGWRRSGTYYYKPDNRNSCCPQYTIRLSVEDFRPRKDQKKVQHRWNKYVLGQQYMYKAARLCPVSREEKRRDKTSFDLCRAVHKSEYGCIKRPTDNQTKTTIAPAHQFEVTLEPDTFTAEKYSLFENYQRVVHREGPNEISRTGFKRFLCSGMGQKTVLENGKEKLLGSYHQCYRLNGRLVAVGVLDLLPDCVSSVYLMYHQDVNEWQFGKLSAFREIAFALENSYRYYYMGYYIHSCVKMRYKADYRPSYLLDPVSHTWDPIDKDLLLRLSARPFISLALERKLEIPSDPTSLKSFLDSHSSTYTAPNHLESKIEVGNVSYTRARDYIIQHPEGSTNMPPRLALSPPSSAFPSSSGEDSDEDSDHEKQPKSVFEAGTPGALSLEEVEASVDLGQWPIRLGEMLATLEDLNVWETTTVNDVDSIKGVAAELAACIGPELVAQGLQEQQGLGFTLQF